MQAKQLELAVIVGNLLAELAQEETNPEKLVKINTAMFCITKLAPTLSLQRVSIEA